MPTIPNLGGFAPDGLTPHISQQKLHQFTAEKRTKKSIKLASGPIKNGFIFTPHRGGDHQMPPIPDLQQSGFTATKPIKSPLKKVPGKASN